MVNRIGRFRSNREIMIFRYKTCDSRCRVWNNRYKIFSSRVNMIVWKMG